MKTTTLGLLMAWGCGCIWAANRTEEHFKIAGQTDSSKPRLGVVTNSYYDFLINEGSYKFWAVFQLVTVAILLYSTFAAIYYAKYTFLKEVENSDVDDFLLRSSRRSRQPFLGLQPATFQRIMDATAAARRLRLDLDLR